MNLTKPLLLSISLLIFSIQVKAQSNLVFENVIQRSTLYKPATDSNYTYNFEYLSGKQLEDLGLGLRRLLRVDDGLGSNDFHLFYDVEENEPCESVRIIDNLVIRSDSMDIDMVDENGNFYGAKVPGMTDSTWYFENIEGVTFNEDWIFDTIKFTCEIKSKMCMPMVYRKGKEDLGSVGMFWITPAKDPKNFKVLTDFIITDVFVKQDPMTQDQLYAYGNNSEIDFYKLTLFMNATIDQLKSGKLKAYPMTIPLRKSFSKKEMKTMFTDEFTSNKHEKFPVRYKMYNYRFKMVEKWMFDPMALAFKKEALGIVLMKRNETKDLTKNADGFINYTFTTVAYVPFNQK